MRLRTIAVLVVIAAVLAACSRGPRQIRPAIDPELLNLSKEQVFQKAEAQFEDRKWQRARTYYQHVYETYPNDPLGRRSLLRIADTFFRQGDAVNLIEAQYKYRDFLNRYPTSDQADYAALQIAMSAFKQMERPDRDQQKTREAVEKLNEMLRSYPKSELRAEAEARLQEAMDRLAKHEHIIARFYMKRDSWPAAQARLNYIMENYPNYSDRAGVFFDLAEALAGLGRTGEARLYFERVVTEFPDSEYAARARRRLDNMKA